MDLIITVRGVQVLLDSDVAMLYGYEVKRINEAANRNRQRFPERFRFQLTSDEFIACSNTRSISEFDERKVPYHSSIRDPVSAGDMAETA